MNSLSYRGSIESVAVAGDGIAGSLAALMINREYPGIEVYHVYDPDTPPMSIGLGSLPQFRPFLLSLIDHEESVLLEQANLTRKYGNEFVDWNPSNRSFVHAFHDDRDCSYHIDLSELLPLLQSQIDAKDVTKHVSGLSKDNDTARLIFEDGETLTVDLLLDARGFPSENDNIEDVDVIPTNRALLAEIPSVSSTKYTRTIARPHGWIMWVPLQEKVSIGYIFNGSINDDETIRKDLQKVLKQEDFELKNGNQFLSFPSFRSETFYDGTVFRLGNRASFLDPLEATSIGFLVTQLQVLKAIVLKQRVHPDRLQAFSFEDGIERTDRWLQDRLDRIAYFIGWFYSRQSAYDTKFWEHARNCFERYRSIVDESVREDFRQNTTLVEDLQEIDEVDDALNKDSSPDSPEFAQFGPKSFFEMGKGIGAL